MNRDKNEGTNDQRSEADNDDAQEIRVTDRRRIHLGENGKIMANTATGSPSLKPSYVEELEARTRAAEKLVHEVQSRFEQLRNQLQREMDETRLRLNRAADERAQREKADFIAALLPVLDNLQRATEAAETDGSLEVILEGVRRTAASFENALAAAGVEAIESVGQSFDPELHEAVDTIDVKPEMEHKVIAEYAPGYRIGERLLRPARVKVGRAGERLSQTGK
jgi:molecular chaperone GrpE